MEKNIMYYARLAEQYYLRMVGDADAAPVKYVLVSPGDESCLIVPGYTQMAATDLLFRVKKDDGECVSEFLKTGVTVDEIIGMKNCYPTTAVKGIETSVPAECGGNYLYYELPEEIKRKVTRYIFKLNSIEEMTDELYWGWGDDDNRNLFEIIQICNRRVEEDTSTGRFTFSFSVDCDRENTMYPYVDFIFSHFEVCDAPMHPFAYVCYDFIELCDGDDD